jgi:hypothetical protein
MVAAAEGQSTNEPATGAAVKARSEFRATLLARSDMQAPRALPVVRPLRFQEIPASFNVNGVEPRANDQSNTAVQRQDPKLGEAAVQISRKADSAP